MIDRKARNRLAQIGRQLIAGRLKTTAYEQSRPKSEDLAVEEVEAFFSSQYDDTWPPWSYSLVGKWRTSRHARKDAARSLLFLYSEFEYEWPPDDSPTSNGNWLIDLALLLLSATLLFASLMGVVFMTSRFSGPLVWVIAVGTGIASLAAIVFLYRMAWKVDVKAHLRAHERWLAEPRSSRDASVWPFARVSDFEAAKQLPILFRAIPCRRSRHTENLDPRKKAES